ncbi:MAG: Epimerase family protein [Candidatus Celerinatantimonas neptuna]|nr:MAG: Epimerase family protein [Candidatus Celerinatantimonas neptuna]
MRILITGGSGFIGCNLIPHLLAHQHHVVVLSRNPLRTFKKLGHQIQVCQDLADFTNFDQFAAVINLAGEPIVSSRWSQAKKNKICQSRWLITQQLCDKILASHQPPHVFLSGSAVGFYGNQYDTILDEQTPPEEGDFANHVCSTWETLALKTQSRTRVCLLRTGLVLGKNGGMFKQLLPVFKAGIGGPLGNGHQYQPWIHIHDMVHAIEYILNNPQCHGPFNLTAPNPVTNNQFSKSFAGKLHRPCLFRMPSFLLKLILGEMSELLLGGQRAIPDKLNKHGFHFMFKHIDEALDDLLKK